MSLPRCWAGRTLLAALLFVLGSASAVAQDTQSLFDEGMAAYRDGNYDEARSKFRQVVASNPGHADAVALLGASEDALLELLIAGGEFETFAREILATASTGTREAMRDADAATQDAAAVFAEDLNTRNEAIFALGMKYGPFAAPPLVAALADAKESRRLAAIYALSRMGSRVTVPLMAAARSTNEQVRMGVLHVMNALGDERTEAIVADLAENDASGTVRALAAQIRNHATPPAQQHSEQAHAWFHGQGGRGLAAVENYGVLWTIEGSRLTPYDVPPSVVAFELAKHHLLRAQELGNSEAATALAVVYAAEVAALGGVGATGEDVSAQSAAQKNALLTIPHAAINDGLHWALDNGMPMVAEALIEALDGSGGRDWSGLRAALNSGQTGPRVAAAIALAHQDVFDAPVISALAEAVGYEAIRVVHVVDGDAQRAAALAAALNQAGVTCVVAHGSGEGIANMRMAMMVDAFVIADPLPDSYARRVVEMVRGDARFGSAPVFVLGNEDTAIEDAEVVESMDAATVIGAFAELDSERQRYEMTAAAAANGLAYAAYSNKAGSAVPALENAAGRGDSVAMPALWALGRTASASSASVIQSVVADTGRSSEVRVAAANAAADFHGRRGGALDAQIFQAAMLEGDAALASACARVLGVMNAGHLSASVAMQ